jgi:hypothetical protein
MGMVGKNRPLLACLFRFDRQNEDDLSVCFSGVPMPSFLDAISAAKSLVPGLPDPSSLLASFASAFSQGNQALKLHLSADAGIPEGTLLPHHLTGHQGINEGLRLELQVLSNNASLELKNLLGIAVLLSVVTDSRTPS